MLRFTSDSGMDKELVRYDRNFVREGVLTKARLQRRQKRHCFLFNDLLLYAVRSCLLGLCLLWLCCLLWQVPHLPDALYLL